MPTICRCQMKTNMLRYDNFHAWGIRVATHDVARANYPYNQYLWGFFPSCRGRGISAAPEFCPVSLFRALVIFFWKFQHDISSSMGMCKFFFFDTTKIQYGRQRSKLKFFVGAKTLIVYLKSEIIQIVLSHNPRYGDVQVPLSRFY